MTDAKAVDKHRRRARQILDALPVGSSCEDVLRALAFDRQIQRGLVDLKAHRSINTDILRDRLRSWHD